MKLSRAAWLRQEVEDYDAVAGLAADGSRLVRRFREERGERVSKRDEWGDLRDSLVATAQLLWAESVLQPIRSAKTHESHVEVLAIAVDRLRHPNKQVLPRSGSPDFSDSARRRLARWYWATTFSAKRIPDSQVLPSAKALLDWAAGGETPPQEIKNFEPPDLAWVQGVRYRGGWKFRAALALLSQLDPPDFLTGERLSVRQHFAGRIEAHHVFPKKWAKASGEDLDVNALGNIAPISGYTNAWIGKRPPADYLEALLERVSDSRLEDILKLHLTSAQELRKMDFRAFLKARERRIHKHISKALTSEV